jgi:hypothetical protein
MTRSVTGSFGFSVASGAGAAVAAAGAAGAWEAGACVAGALEEAQAARMFRIMTKANARAILFLVVLMVSLLEFLNCVCKLKDYMIIK